MIKKLLLFLILILAVTGCGLLGDEEEATPAATAAPTQAADPTATTASEPVSGEAAVDSLQIQIMESFPVQVNALVRGELADGCTTIDAIATQRQGETFRITLNTIRDADAVCTQATVPYEETVSLDVLGLPAGTYTVLAGENSGTFTLDVDNEPGAEPTPTLAPTATAVPEPTDDASAAATGRISGVVWHDLCAVAEAADEAEEDIPSDGCIALAEGDFQANGLLEAEEPGIAGVTVDIGEGECPTAGLATAVTDTDGQYSFPDLPAGDYCVSVNPLSEANEPILIPGAFTFPEDLLGQNLLLTAGQEQIDINFGWDYQFLPLPDVDFTTCRNSIQFIEDLSIPDNTPFAPGAEFTKSWRLRNNGTCPWITDYSLVYVGGDDIPGPEVISLTQAIAPGQTVDLSVTFTAPEEFGTYRENWQLADSNGQPFGVNGFIEEAFWVQIVVGEPEPTPEPGTATIGGVVWRDFCSTNADGSPTANCVETAEGSGFFVGNGGLDRGEQRIPELVVSLADGACPADDLPPAIATAVTDADGLYRFTGLEEGTYCVFIDAFSDANVNLLIPGDWTWPFRGVGLQGVVLAAGEEALTIDFGWDDADD